MEAEVYPNDRIRKYISEQFVPIKIHVKEQPDMFQRFGAQWTPTGIILDSEGKEQHRFEGFLPVDDFLAQLQIGLAKMAFSHGQFKDSEKRFTSVVDQFPNSEAAPEALYWAGVSRYKKTGDGNALTETGRQFQSRYRNTSWAKKASVWVEQPAAK